MYVLFVGNVVGICNNRTCHLQPTASNVIVYNSQYATQQAEYSRVITLEYWCQTKGQINHYFSPNTPISQTKKDHADLFDWLFIDNYSLLADALYKNLEDFFEFDDFKWSNPTGNTPNDHINTKYKMNWNHLTGNHEKLSRKVESVESMEEYAVIFPQIKSKINYLRQKFIAAQEYSTLYVISHPQIGPSKIDIEKLRNAITHIRYGKTNFSILFISANPVFDSFENVYVRHSTPIGSDWTQADSARWKEILDEFKFSTTIWD